MVFTSQQGNSDTNKRDEQQEVTSSDHITSQECEDSESEIELAETTETFEDEGKAIVDELKELNLETTDEPCPIYVRSLLTPEEEKKYFNLFLAYKGVFAWSYREMPRLDPKVVVHRLSLKRGVSPKKKPE